MFGDNASYYLLGLTINVTLLFVLIALIVTTTSNSYSYHLTTHAHHSRLHKPLASQNPLQLGLSHGYSTMLLESWGI